MKKSRYTPQQIVSILKEHEGGKAAVEVCRDRGLSQQTLYTWRKRYGSMDASELKRLKELGAENTKLKRMYAELALDHELAKEIIAKKP